ncbi:type VI secretion system tip protein VgrG, partial [Erwinia amylovora]|nr:type VI secretion system tip protein VgrG [Erwinia amylovora]
MDGLLVWRLSGREALSQSCELSVQLLSPDARIERRALLGQPITGGSPTQGLLNTRDLNGKITKVSVSSQAL